MGFDCRRVYRGGMVHHASGLDGKKKRGAENRHYRQHHSDPIFGGFILAFEAIGDFFTGCVHHAARGCRNLEHIQNLLQV